MNNTFKPERDQPGDLLQKVRRVNLSFGIENQRAVRARQRPIRAPLAIPRERAEPETRLREIARSLDDRDLRTALGQVQTFSNVR